MHAPYSINIEGHIRARGRDIKYFMARIRVRVNRLDSVLEIAAVCLCTWP